MLPISSVATFKRGLPSSVYSQESSIHCRVLAVDCGLKTVLFIVADQAHYPGPAFLKCWRSGLAPFCSWRPRSTWRSTLGTALPTSAPLVAASANTPLHSTLRNAREEGSKTQG